MRKIVFSFLTIFSVIGVVAGSAYALFSSTATVNGLTFSTGNADLQLSTDGSLWSNTLDSFPSYTNMSTGFQSTQEFYLKNNSLSNIGLEIFVQLLDNNESGNSTAWPIIGDNIIVNFQMFDGLNWVDLATNTLSYWKESDYSFGSLAYDSSQKYRMTVSLDGLADEDAGQTLSDLNLQFVGTQQ